MPAAIKELGPIPMEISLESYRWFWSKTKENTACYPNSLSFSRMKAGASSAMIAEIERMLVLIPLWSGNSP
jgi:hypothetical protein